MRLRRLCHRLVDEFVDARSEVAGRKGGLPSKAGDRFLGRGEVERRPAAAEEAGVLKPEEEVRVGDGRPGAAAAIARGTGIRAGGLGADEKTAERVEGRDAATAGSHFDQVDRRDCGGPA